MRTVTGMRPLWPAHLPVAFAVGLLAACGGPPEPARLRHAASQGAGVANAPAPDDPTADMVNAVSSADGKPPVYLKFRLADVPQVGHPMELQIALIQEPKLEIDVLKLSLAPREGLLLKSPSTIDLGKPQVGETHMLSVNVVPQQSGVLSLAVTVLVDTEHESLTRAYTVPLIVPQIQAAAPTPAPATPASAR